MLAHAGIDVAVMPASVDEAAVKAEARKQGCPAAALTLRLAAMKAMRVAMRRPGALVIGADQLLEHDGAWFDKPRDLDDAAAHIRRLRGQSHDLITTACCVRGGRLAWHYTATPRLVMRDVTDAFIGDYVAREGEALLSCVGAYRLEGLGVQLFERIEGDFFTIMGLPLLPLLEFLRQQGVIN